MKPLVFDKKLEDYYENIPKSYDELYKRTIVRLDIDVPKHYFLMGKIRFVNGMKEYMRETSLGSINQCWLPETKTLQDIEEELIDALFNAMVANVKWPESSHIENLIEIIAESLTYLRKIVRWGQLYIDIENGVIEKGVIDDD